MTPLERDLLLEKLLDFNDDVYKIQAVHGDGNNNIIQNLKIKMLKLTQMIKNSCGIEKL